MKQHKIFIWKNAEGQWVVDVDGISVVRANLELYVRKLVDSVVELNPDIEFEVIRENK